MFTLIEILDMAIRIERNGEGFYRDAMEKVSNPSSKAFLKMLAEEEVRHMEWFAAKKSTFQSEKRDPLLDQIGSSMLEGIIGDQTFSLKELDISQLSDEQALFQAAIEFERDTIVFFEMIQAFVGNDDVSEELKEIIEEEYRHIDFLRRCKRAE